MNEVSRMTLVSRRSVSKVVHHYQQYGTAEPFKIGGKHPTKLMDGVLQAVELAKLQKPSITTKEIRMQLANNNYFPQAELPSLSTINDVNDAIRSKLQMTFKRISPIPMELKEEKVNDYIDLTSRLDPNTLHFFMNPQLSKQL